MKPQIKIGSRIKLNKSLEMHNRTYPIGYQFTVIGSSGFRGWDIRDDEGNYIYECAFIQNTFELIDRNEKIDIILS